jgi:competence protein ComEC
MQDASGWNMVSSGVIMSNWRSGLCHIVRPIASAFLLVVSPATFAQTSDLYVVRNTATPCHKVRPNPDTSEEPVDCLVPRTPVMVLEAKPYWRKIDYGAQEPGWAAKKYLEPAVAPEPTDETGVCTTGDPWLHVHFVDVGQGDAIWIHTPDDMIDGNGRCEGLNIVIDGGPKSANYENQLFQYHQPWAHHGAVVDALFVTHPHDDHYPGAETIARHFVVRDYYYDPGFPTSSSAYQAFRDPLDNHSDELPTVDRFHIGWDNFGDLDWGNELTAEVLYSYIGPSGLESGNTDPNNASIVLRLQYGGLSFLFMGDAEGKTRTGSPVTARYVEKYLLDHEANKLKATVLKVGHHGSETSSTTPFIEAVDPSIVGVQSGRKVYSGRTLPDASTLRRFCCHEPSIHIYRTDQNDEADGLAEDEAADNDHIVIRTNGAVIETELREGGEPFFVSGCQPVCAE